MNDSLLRTSLLDLLHALGNDAQGILLGGGYGLYLKQLHLAEVGVRTLIGAELWPAPRATEDRVPPFLQDRYRFFAGQLMGQRCLFMADKAEEQTPAAIRKHIDHLRSKWNDPAV